MTLDEYVVKTIRSLEEGEKWTIHVDGSDYYLVVKNPDFKPDVGNDENFVLKIAGDDLAERLG